MLGLLKKVFGTANERELKRLRPMVDRINQLEEKVSSYTDPKLQAKTAELREKLDKGASLEELLPMAFACVREASKRTLGMRHYDVQLVGGVVLHDGKIAEMRTGEGKTLVATLSCYLNALAGKGVHVVTVNDYLARRDADWMGQIHRFLGLSVGVIVHDLSDEDRRRAYGADITYGTNNELGFDYLRDNMKFEVQNRVQRGLQYCVVDEVDSILVDEARTPLIISGPAEKSSDLYYKINAVIPFLKRDEDFLVDEKSHTATLTDSGVDKVETRLKLDNLYEADNVDILQHVHQALKAHTLYKRDVTYVVEQGKVVIVDEFTGRKMPGRRWSDGLHQAVEAKEGLRIEEENETLATVTFQNFFRLYKKLGGMTGTADTEAAEFDEIYKLRVVVIPTNKPMIRKDFDDRIYKNEPGKWRAVCEEIVGAHDKGQPVLVGTTSVEKSEYLSGLLTKRGVVHNVLNAKYHEREAHIVAQAGRKGAVTIATNMAGRGTDIVLGGNFEVLAADAVGTHEGPEYEAQAKALKPICEAERQDVLTAGGLFIIGTERHESRRVDNQLRGRAGRQGDIGTSRFYLSLDDELMRIFAGDRLKSLMERLNMPDDEPIEARMVSRAVEGAQKRVEARNFDMRKNVLEYDDVMNLQRKAIYGLRDRVLVSHEEHQLVLEAIDAVVERMADEHFPESASQEHFDVEGFKNVTKQHFTVAADLSGVESPTFEGYRDYVAAQVRAAYEKHEQELCAALMRAAVAQGATATPEVARERWRFFERERYLRAIDKLWRHHLRVMESLREGIGLHGYGQRDPKIEYKKQGHELFLMMADKIKDNVTEVLFRAEGPTEEEIQRMRAVRLEEERRIMERHAQAMADQQAAQSAASTRVVHQGGTYTKDDLEKIGRNELCPCGSGQKYKKCHEGRTADLKALLLKKTPA
jgi:preprotein translocase subunit SecA